MENKNVAPAALRYNEGIEALRGFCALMVFVYHLIIQSDVMNGGSYNFRKLILPYAPGGHLMVMIFFVLSGYVIGLSYYGKPSFKPGLYLKKRLVRIYPVYLVAILLSVLFLPEEGWRVIGNVFFLQNISVEVLENNKALWSLSHEMIYYILAIPILQYRLSVKQVLAILGALVVFSFLSFPLPGVVEAYAVGFSFWLIGFLLSTVKPNTAPFREGYNKVYALFLLLLASDFLNLPGAVLSKIPFAKGTTRFPLDNIIVVNDYGVLLLSIYAVVVFMSNAKWVKWLTVFVYLMGWLHLAILLVGGGFYESDIFLAPAFFLLISTLLQFIKAPVFRSVKYWAYIGSISYCLYVIHTPFIFLMGKITAWSGNTLTFTGRSLFIAAVVIALSHLVERMWQPKLKHRLLGGSLNDKSMPVALSKENSLQNKK